MMAPAPVEDVSIAGKVDTKEEVESGHVERVSPIALHSSDSDSGTTDEDGLSSDSSPKDEGEEVQATHTSE